jgi:hypothetical protein
MDFVAILNAVQSHAQASGLFERVNGAEPANPPGNGLTAAVWADTIGPAPAGSGLAATTARFTLMLRIYSNMLQDPPDAIDPEILAAVDALMTAYAADFQLGGLVRNVDLLGQTGPPMAAQAGYVQQDGALYRVMTITLPVLVNDAWTQAP